MSAIPELNSAPFFDDYSPETKDFLRILFRPGYAVQARELNQLQSILQTQVERFGNHIFKEGSIVVGGMTTIDTKTPKYLKILDSYSGTPVVVSSFINKEITGVTSSAKGYVVAVAETEGADPKTLIYVPQNGISFIASETISVTGGGNATIQATSFNGPSSTVSIDYGIFFIKGFFVVNQKQTAYLEKYSNVPNRKAGLLANIAIFDEGDDETLLDNARGSYNYAAPGANRLKINLTLASKELGFTTDTDKFIELLEVRSGQLYKQITRPTYSEIEKTLARRTYDESGDYTVKPFLLDVQNHPTDEGFLRAYIESGKAYVKGYEFETISRQYVDIDKARDTESYGGFDIPLNYGNYVIVTFDEGFPNISLFETLNLCNAGGYTSVIGTCQVSSIQIHDSTLFQYKLYLFNVALITGNGIIDARSISNGINPASSNAKSFNIVSPLGFPYGLNESDLQSYVFETGLKSVSNLTDIDYSTKKVFTSSSSGTSFSFSTAAAGRDRFQGLGTITDPITKATHYTVIDNSSGEQITSFTTFVSSAGTGSEQSATITVPSNAPTGITLIATINVNGATARVKTKTKIKTHTSTAQAATTNTITLASTASSVDDFYNGCKIKLISGTGSAATTYTVLDYVGATKVLTITSTFSVTPNNSTGYQIAPASATSDDLANGRKYISSAGSSHSLDVSDGIRIIKIVNGTSTDDWFDNSKDVTNRYIFDNGQRDFSYEYANIILRAGQTAPSGAIVVFFEYFSSNTSGFFSVNSYTDYSEVSSYISSTGKVFDLRNCIDFRPVKTAGAYTVSSLPIARTNMNTDITYYLPRIDKIVATTDRQFKVLRGVSSLSPKMPSDIGNGMTLYSIYLNAYTFNNLDVVPKYVENKNYTMRDIGKLEERLNNVEYYSLLNSLEKDTASMDILDAAGNERYKNGFIVDTFSGHGIGDVFNADYKCAIDFTTQECRPRFNVKSYDLSLKTGESSGYTRWQNGPLLTKSFSEATFISQLLASQTVNVNPFSVFAWRGTMSIDPSVDYWKDERFRPTNVINVNSVNDNLTFGNDWGGSRWNNWQETFQGVDSEDDRVEDRLARGELGANLPSVVIPLIGPGSPSDPGKWFYQEIGGVPSWVSGVSGEVSPAILGGVVVHSTPVRNNSGSAIANNPPVRRNNNSITLGEKVVDVSSIPWMRSKTITFTVTGMKPNTLVYPFFDDVNISSNITWSSSNTTSATGSISGTFLIPDNKFLCGDRILRLSDSSTNTTSAESTFAQARYTANGILIHRQTETIGIRPPEPEISVYQDPLAQSFYVDPIIYPEGLFISSVDVFFKTKDNNIPVTVQIRPTVNGYPSSSKVLPFSERSLPAASVSTSLTGSIATNFPFKSVVYLEPGEYSLVILANSNNYEVFIAEIGRNKIDSTELISEQPYVGSLFKSQNSSTWTAEQTQDLKFVLKRCNFSTGNFTVVLSDYASALTKLVYASGTSGADTVVVSSVLGLSVGQSVSGSNIGIGAVITSINGFILTLSVVNSGTVASNITITGKPDGLGYADTFWLGLSTSEFKNASFSSTFVSTPVSGSLETVYTNVIPNKNFTFGSQRNILASAESFKHRIVGQTSSQYLSPVIDMEKNVLLTIQNDINNDSTNETNSSGGNARSKYITRRITLQSPADYLKIFLTAVRTSGTDIEVYYKVRSDSDAQNFSNKSWVLMSQEYPLANVYSANDSDFKEYIFYPLVAGYNTTASIKYLTSGVTYDSFIEFAVKIVFKSSNTSIIPKIADFRGIALDTI